MNKYNSGVLDESTQRTSGKSARTSNIDAAIAVSDIVKTTLGPMGMDKMLIDSVGEIVITNDGVKILQEMEIEHPGAKMIVEVAKTQEQEVGDGTTSAVILSGKLLENAKELLVKNIHPNLIVKNYKLASNKAIESLNDISIDVDLKDENLIKQVSQTAMIGKVAEFSKEFLSDLLLETVNLIREENEVDKNKIKIIKSTGGNIEDSEIVKGVVLDKEPCSVNMPNVIENPKVLLVDFPLEPRELETDAKVNINSLEEYEAFLNSEKEYLVGIVSQIKKIGANVVICQKGVDDELAYFLAKEGILATRRTRKSDLEKLSYALNVRVISSPEEILEENLGVCGKVEKKRILNENYIFVEECSNPKAVTLFLKASTKHVLDEVERAVDDSLGDLASILKSKKIVAGGGAVELELYLKLIEFSKEFTGKERLVIESFAESFLAIPQILSENCGYDTIEMISKLISNHENNKNYSGIFGEEGIVENTKDKGIIEPINVKLQAIKSATESSCMILRIDDIIAARKLNSSSPNSQGFEEF